MELLALTAISPIDGRYRDQVQHLDKYFSEFSLIKYRVQVEVAYLFFLAENKLFKLPSSAKNHLQNVLNNFSLTDAHKIKDAEKITNHDVKAVEYFLKEELEKCGGNEIKEWGADMVNRYYKISIRDNGIGFDPQNAEKIFDIFQRLNNSPAAKGSGIGLAICKRIVQNHHGFIKATGKSNVGATFDIFLPVNL